MPAPPDLRRSPRGMDEAIARLSAELRGSGPAAMQPDKKFRFDFRTHRSAKPAERAEPEHEAGEGPTAELPALDAAAAGLEALQNAIDWRWSADAIPSDPAPVPAPGETADAQLEAIRQRLAELSGGRASREAADLMQDSQRPRQSTLTASQPPEQPESRRGFGLSVLENHLARLAGEVAMLGQRRAPADPELLSRITEIRDLVVANNAGAEIERLERQIAAIGEHIDSLFAAMPRPESVAEIARRVDAVSTQIAELAADQNRPLAALDNLTREISLLRREVAATVRRPDTGLDAQIAALAGRIDAIGQNAGGPMLAKLEAQVAAMAARLDAGTITAAQARAPDGRQDRATPAAPATPSASSGGAENLLIMALKEDLLRLQASRSAGALPGPAQPAQKPVLRKAERPTPPEEPAWQSRSPEIRQPPRREAERAIEDHRPLEPGSGRPAHRAASASKSEFVAAARRAAVAAAAESEMAQPAARQRMPAPADGGTTNMFRGRRGAAMIAAGVVAIGLAAVPMLLFSEDRDAAVLAGRDGALSPAEEVVVALEDLPVAKTEPKLTQPQPAAAPDVAPLPSIAIDPATPTENRFTIVDPGAPIGPAMKDASRPPSVSPDVTAATPPLAGPAADPFRQSGASLQPAPLPPEAVGPERLRNAAASGDATALFEVASRYAEGRGVPANAAEAAKWYKLAAERGLAIAQFRVASLYERGEGVEQSRMAAAEWYRRAAEQGNVRAMHNLAVMLSEGIGGPPDFGDAARWFIKGADHGVRDSQYNLGVMFARGLGGEQDLVRSYKWFAIAAQQGDPDAGMRRDEVAKSLSPDQLAQAQAAVRAWRAIEPPAAANVPPVADDSWNAGAGPASVVDRQALVRLIQERLAERGFDPGPADGHPGPKTREAVIAFQREQGVPATGEIGPDILAALDLPAR
jgi:localization factor PodJL